MADERARLLKLIKETGALQKGEFTLSSGKKSSYYFNGKLITLHPEGLYLACALLYEEIQKGEIDAISGKSIGADPLIAGITLLSFLKGKPMKGLMIRESAKLHGTRSQIEGDFRPGMKVALVDDVLTTGRSLFHAAQVLREKGACVSQAYVLLDRQEGGREALRANGLSLQSLFEIDALVAG